MSGKSLQSEHFLWLLGSLCQTHRLPWDAALALQRFAPPHARPLLVEAAAAYGFRLGAAPLAALDWSQVHFPVVAFSQEGTPLLVVRGDADRLLAFEPGSREPRLLARADAAAQWEAEVLLVAHETAAPVFDEEGGGAEKFGFRWFGRELLKHRRVWRDIVLASAAIQLVGLATPLFTQVVIDKVVVHHTQSTLAAIAVGLAVFMVFSSAMTWLRQYFILHTGNRVDAVLGSEVFWHLLRLPLPYFEHRPTGTLVARLHAVETIREFLAGAAVSLVLDLPFLAVFLAVMFWYSWPLSLIALGILLAIAGLSVAVTPLLRAKLNRQFLLGARNQAFVTEYVAGMETVKALQMEAHLRGRYDGLLAEYLAAGFGTRQLSNSFNVAANALEQAMTLSILCVGALLVMNNPGFTIGMLVAFQMFAGRLSQPMLRLAGLWQEFQQANIAVKRLGDVMDAPAEPHALLPSRAPGGTGRVEIADLAFRYSPAHPFLYRNLTLALAPGRLTVLAGPSGSGKSTLAKLLLGFYPATEGQIRIDGHDIRHFSANELRQYFGVVPQETVLFSGTVYDNLVAAHPQAGFPDVVKACQFAEIHDTIERLPQGYQSLLGEHGTGLSGGQKQRLAIARALLRRPRILLFDEATASLDTATAERLAQTVNRLKGQVTILFITHHIPRGLAVDDVFSLGGEKATRGHFGMHVVEEPQ